MKDLATTKQAILDYRDKLLLEKAEMENNMTNASRSTKYNYLLGEVAAVDLILSLFNDETISNSKPKEDAITVEYNFRGVVPVAYEKPIEFYNKLSDEDVLVAVANPDNTPTFIGKCQVHFNGNLAFVEGEVSSTSDVANTDFNNISFASYCGSSIAVLGKGETNVERVN